MNSRVKKIVIAVAVVAGIGALSFIGVMGVAAVLGWRAATRAGNEAATIQNLKTIAAVEVQYFETHNRTFGTFDQLVARGLISSKFAGDPAIADGYVLKLSLASKPDRASSYKITADPQNASQGTSHFYLDSDDVGIHVNSEHPAGPADPFF